jgi:hypothetical protein
VRFAMLMLSTLPMWAIIPYSTHPSEPATWKALALACAASLRAVLVREEGGYGGSHLLGNERKGWAIAY